MLRCGPILAVVDLPYKVPPKGRFIFDFEMHTHLTVVEATYRHGDVLGVLDPGIVTVQVGTVLESRA